MARMTKYITTLVSGAVKGKESGECRGQLLVPFGAYYISTLIKIENLHQMHTFM